MYNQLIQVNKRNIAILSFYVITIYNYEYYKNKDKNHNRKR
jgi:hypothetical protein